MKYALFNYKKANLDSTIKGLFHLSINDLENYLSFIQCPHVFMSTRLHVYTYTSGREYMYTKSHHQIIRLDDGSKLYKTISIDVGVIYVEIGVRNLCSRNDH